MAKLAYTAERKLQIYPWSTRLHALPVPTSGICDAPLVCLQINSEWASHIAGSMEILRWKDSWLGTDEEVAAALQAVEELMDKMSCICDNTPQYLQFLQNQMIYSQLLTSSYDGTITSIDIDSPDTDFDGDTDDVGDDPVYRDLALCFACRLLVDSICAQVLAHNGDTQALLTFLVSIFGLIPGGAGVAFLVGAGISLLININNTAFADDAAKQNMACCLYDALKGQTNTKSNFAASDDACYTEGSSYERDIADAFRSLDLMNLQENWIAFNKALADGYRAAKIGAIDSCECGEWCHLFDFTADDSGWSLSSTLPAPSQGGVYVSNQYWSGTQVPGYPDYRTCAIIKLATPVYVTTIRCKYWCENARLTGENRTCLVDEDFVAHFSDSGGNVDTAITINRYVAQFDLVMVDVDADTSPRIYEIEICGNGDDPFEE